jgi:hypothetical protein
VGFKTNCTKWKIRACSRKRSTIEIQLVDTVKARRIPPDGSSMRAAPGGQPALRAQERLYEASGPGGVLA